MLDTSVLVAAERDAEALDRAIADDDDVAIAAISVAELQVGVELASGKRRARRLDTVERILDAVEIEDYTVATAGAHARLLAATRRVGTPRGAHDLIIAATALATGRTLVTGDRSAFEELGLDVRYTDRSE
jgi:tRNA(fMet)-specific endonuclease VapC